MSNKIINEYELLGELVTNNSGFSRWGFATKNGEEFFIKEFLTPVYPENEAMFTPRQLMAKKNGCALFEKDNRELYSKINGASDGNLACIEEFFRFNSKYYIVMKKIKSVKFEDASTVLDYQKRLRLCIILAHSLGQLHANGVVHGDLKLDNILFTESKNKRGFVAKLIDFDNSFVLSRPPADNNEFQIDQVFCAPETFRFLCGEEIRLNEKIDVFAMGLIFHYLLTGSLPVVQDIYKHVFEAVLHGENILLNGVVAENEELSNIILDMLKCEPQERPTMGEVLERLGSCAEYQPRTVIDVPPVMPVETSPEPSKPSGGEMTVEAAPMQGWPSDGEMTIEAAPGQGWPAGGVMPIETAPVQGWPADAGTPLTVPSGAGSRLKINMGYKMDNMPGVNQPTSEVATGKKVDEFFSLAGDL